MGAKQPFPIAIANCYLPLKTLKTGSEKTGDRESKVNHS